MTPRQIALARVFGNAREVVTFEAKIEHNSSQEVSAYHVGQAHNQYARATSEFGTQGYLVAEPL